MKFIKMSITTEVATIEMDDYRKGKVEEDRDPNNLNEHLQVSISMNIKR